MMHILLLEAALLTCKMVLEFYKQGEEVPWMSHKIVVESDILVWEVP